MKIGVVGLSLGLVLSCAQAQQVWRCESEGQVVYTDQPCEKPGKTLPVAQLKANVAAAAGAAGSGSEAASGVPESAESPGQPGSAADALASAQAARPTVRPWRRDPYMSRVAMQGLMDTDFVLRGYMLRRQSQTAAPTP